MPNGLDSLRPTQRYPEVRQDILVGVQDVLDELGVILAKESTIFPEANMQRIIADWIWDEQSICLADCGIKDITMSTIEDDPKFTQSLFVKLKKYILYSVCARVLNRAQNARRNAGDLNYRSSMLKYEDLADRFGLEFRMEYVGIDTRKSDVIAEEESEYE